MKTSVLARKPPVSARFQGHVLRPGHGRHRAAAQNAAAQARALVGARAPLLVAPLRPEDPSSFTTSHGWDRERECGGVRPALSRASPKAPPARDLSQAAGSARGGGVGGATCSVLAGRLCRQGKRGNPKRASVLRETHSVGRISSPRAGCGKCVCEFPNPVREIRRKSCFSNYSYP